MSDQELQAQFKLCKQWNDPEQWKILADLYQARGYVLNADYCRKQACVEASVRFVVGEVVA